MNKLTLMAELYHKPAYFEPSECVVEKIIPLHHEKFQELTEKEKSLLDVISKAADRMAQYAHMGKKELYFEDVLNDIGYDLDEIKDMIIHAAARKLSTKEDISAVEVNELDIPLQPELTVIPKDEHNAEEEIGVFSY